MCGSFCWFYKNAHKSKHKCGKHLYIEMDIIYFKVHHHRHGYAQIRVHVHVYEHVYGDIAYTSGVPYRKIE